MEYIKRAAEKVIEKQEKMFKTILITGARQVGKTTILKNMKKDINYITLDDLILAQSAKEDPNLFFKSNKPPIIIDEIQYVPELLRNIKMIVDETEKNGMFYLTGSQKFSLMKGVSESMAGRVGILNLLGLSMREIKKIDFNLPFLPTEKYLEEREKNIVDISYDEIWEIIHKGSMPKVYDKEVDIDMFYGMYVSTYLERDVRSLTQVGDIMLFLKFMV